MSWKQCYNLDKIYLLFYYFMRNIFLFLFITFVLSSCSKIQPEINNSKLNYSSWEIIEWNKIVWNPEWIWINSDYWVNIIEEKQIEESFKIISNQYNEYWEFLRSPQYKDFVDNIHNVFKKYKELEWNNEKELSYIFEVLIPRVVINNWFQTWKIWEEETELIIQSIKRKEFNSLEYKKLISERFKIYMEEKIYNPYIKELTAEKISEMKKDKTTFVETLLNPDRGIIYTILKNRYDWNKTWIGYKPSQLEWSFASYLNNKMVAVFWILWYTDKEVEKMVFEYYSINSLEELAWLIKNDFNFIVQKYNLVWKIPFSREYRNDEQNDIFKDKTIVDQYISTISNEKNKEFENDLKELRLKMYLISYFWKDRKDLDKDQWLWSSRARSEFIDKGFWDGVQNLFRLSRYISWEEMEIVFDKKF